MRLFKQVFFTLSALVAMTGAVQAQSLFNEGADYTALANPLDPQKAGQKEVIEIFSYTCPHCYNLESHINEWAENTKPESVGFYKIPATGGYWEFTARVKYVAEKLGLGHDFDMAYFDAIHKDKQRKLMGDKKAAIEFIATFAGISPDEVEKSWKSLQVERNLKRSEQIYQQSGVTGVPAVLVNGKYMVKLGSNYERFFQVIDYLLKTTDVK
ncbi:thiol:disulfide interchange protein DsbA/DsbL [Ostreibacterium oceani]|uniref:Thiol:disulfide interchange protein n=1 Tax=Ostreibacterium oceani TaxID=2654998 RepID=A0A6N7EWC3_9GAMM|nr:thiol:disulfide interchange protein DsbA/DsbL [Ostreibacterium oceani]MPV85850.1 thioredoxin domain-containing protein [Ostreibacterium oceani]